MSTGRITNRQVRAVADVSGGPGEVYPDGLTESVIDALLDEVDRELVAGECSATVRVSRDFTDQRRARRAARRAGRVVLRSLPVRLDPAELGWEAA